MTARPTDLPSECGCYLPNMCRENVLLNQAPKFNSTNYTHIVSTQLNLIKLNPTQLNSTELSYSHLSSTQLNSKLLTSTKLNSTQFNPIYPYSNCFSKTPLNYSTQLNFTWLGFSQFNTDQLYSNHLKTTKPPSALSK